MKSIQKGADNTLKVVSHAILGGLALVGFVELFNADERIKFLVGILFIASLLNNILRK